MDTIGDLLIQENLVDSYGMASSSLATQGNMSALVDDTRYALCNTSTHVSLPLCNRSGLDDYKTGFHLDQNTSRLIAIIVSTIFGAIVIIGFIGNALVVLVVAANQQMRNTTNLLIINLALADLLFIVFCVPFTAVDYALTLWPFGDLWCKIVQYLVIVTAYASVYTLVLMSLDRFLAVVYPIASMGIRTEANTYLAIFVAWLVIVVVCIPTGMAHGEVGYVFSGQDFTVCTFLADSYSLKTFQITFFVTSYVIPLLLICGLYLCMLMRLWHGVAPGGRVSAESRRGKKRVTRMVIVVVVIFAVCWCPIQIVLVLKSLELYGLSSILVTIQIGAHILAYMNSCINPILYAFLSDNFRKAFRKVIYCKALGTSAHVLTEQRGVNGQPNNNAEKSDVRQPLCNGNELTHTTQLKSTVVHARVNGVENDNEAIDVV